RLPGGSRDLAPADAGRGPGGRGQTDHRLRRADFPYQWLRTQFDRRRKGHARVTDGSSDNPIPMTSNRPYLLRAIYDWISDNRLTPYVLVDASVQGVRVPPQAVRNGQVVLNLDMQAV